MWAITMMWAYASIIFRYGFRVNRGFIDRRERLVIWMNKILQETKRVYKGQ